jgi:putative transposase
MGSGRFVHRDEKRFDRAQRSLARKQKGSRNRTKAWCKVVRIRAFVADRRSDFTHKRSTRIIRENQVVCGEGWNVKGMQVRRTLAQRIADVGWGALLRHLEYNERWYGPTFVPMGRFYPSSKRCLTFGHSVDHLPHAERPWIGT